MKKVVRYSFFAVLTLVLVLTYISYQTSIPVTELVTNAPELISSLKMAEIDEKYIENYTTSDQKVIDVLHYNIAIELFPEERNIRGDVKIKILSKGAAKIDLNFYDNFKISKVLLNGNSVKYENKKTSLSILPTEKLKDISLVEIVYVGRPKSMGFGSFSFAEKDDKSFIYTMNEPVFASTWFPCNDSPSDKALIDIYITNDSSKVSVSNGLLAGVKTAGNRKTYHWKTVYPIATYLIALYSADYLSFSEEYTSASKIKMPITYYVTQDKFESAKKDFPIHKEAITVFSKLFGEYPFIKEKYGVAEFLWNKGALENQTITGIGSSFISGMSFHRDILVHELAHSWWGNAVGLADWKDIWLNEGFATYSVALYYEALTDIRALRSTMRTYFNEFEKGTLYNPAGDVFGRLVYDKGAWVLHMLRKEVGDSSFFKILQKYYQDFKYKNATTNNFKSICESVSKKNLESFFQQWIYKGTGIINAGYSYSVSGADNTGFIVKLKIDQEQDGYKVFSFPLDVKFISAGGKNTVKTVYITKRQEQFELKLDFFPQEVVLDPDNWLLAILNKK
jgi:aminopeptidase N